MNTSNTLAAEFDYGYINPSPTGGSETTSQCGFNVVLGCPITGTSNAAGTITMKVPTNNLLQFFDVSGNHIFDMTIPVGTTLSAITGFTDLPAAGSGLFEIVDQTDGGGIYTTIGNSACAAP
jgi:hypothetical protein